MKGSPRPAQPEPGEKPAVQRVVEPKARKAATLRTKKLTTRITPELDFRLLAIAKKTGESKGDLINRFLEQGAGNYGMDNRLKAIWAEIQPPDVSAA